VSGEISTGGGPLELAVPALCDGLRLDRVVSWLTGCSRTEAAELVGSGAVRVDGAVVTRRSAPLSAGAWLALDRGPASRPALAPEPDVVVPVVFEDDDVVVVDKPWEMVVHPGAGRQTGTLAGGLLARYPDLAQLVAEGLFPADRHGIVHRLDRGTSGLLVVARSPRAIASLSAQLAGHLARRSYLALVRGHIDADRGLIDAPLGRSTRTPTRMAVTSSGREARTEYQVRARLDDPLATLTVVSLQTGRTHQIRVHMAAIGHPVLGDTRYGPGRGQPVGSGLDQLERGRLFLHAFELGFEHPGTGESVRFRSPLPEDLAHVLPAQVLGDLSDLAPGERAATDGSLSDESAG
jgi:23S rRNA pseudouridine1911/1915/1917 synthase